MSDYKIITNDKDKLEINANTIEGYTPDILKIVETFKEKENINPHAINPEYLKLTEAEESKQA